MTLTVLSIMLCLGVLLGTAWTTQAMQPKLRRRADERRRLNDEWLTIRAARRQQSECPRCGNPLIDRSRQVSRR